MFETISLVARTILLFLTGMQAVSVDNEPTCLNLLKTNLVKVNVADDLQYWLAQSQFSADEIEAFDELFKARVANYALPRDGCSKLKQASKGMSREFACINQIDFSRGSANQLVVKDGHIQKVVFGFKACNGIERRFPPSKAELKQPASKEAERAVQPKPLSDNKPSGDDLTTCLKILKNQIAQVSLPDDLKFWLAQSEFNVDEIEAFDDLFKIRITYYSLPRDGCSKLKQTSQSMAREFACISKTDFSRGPANELINKDSDIQKVVFGFKACNGLERRASELKDAA